MTRHHYPNDQHPSWCELGRSCAGEEPNHVGRLSQMFVQSAEARLAIELSRIDDTVPAGNISGPVRVRVTLSQGAAIGAASAELSVDEARAASLLLAQYVEYAEREDRFAIHQSREVIAAEGPM